MPRETKTIDDVGETVVANFIVRVELHGAGSETYEKLHNDLLAKGLVNFVIAHDGSRYLLPSATYSYSGNFAVDAVREWLQVLIAAVHANYWVFVCEAAGTSWFLRRLS
jgi:hypothetical protein